MEVVPGLCLLSGVVVVQELIQNPWLFLTVALVTPTEGFSIRPCHLLMPATAVDRVTPFTTPIHLTTSTLNLA